MLKLVVARRSKRTGELLAELIEKGGVEVGVSKPTAVVSYGVRLGETKLPALNAMAGGRTKLEELRMLRKAGVRIPELIEPSGAGWEKRVLAAAPVMARKLHHQGGVDVRYTTSLKWIKQRMAGGWAYFTAFVPSKTEYRVWVYRSAHLCTYEKSLAHPEKQKNKHTRNHKNGFAFVLVKEERVPRRAVELAKLAVKALDLDFGAVDVLAGTDGKAYVLEVNTAPGVDGERVSSIKLAAKIARWYKKGFPKRKEEG